MKKKNFKCLLKSLIIIAVFLFPNFGKAATLEELKQQFINLGGSNESFNKIIQVVEKSQASSKQLKNKINEVYNKQLYDLMTADNFDYKAYIQTYNDLEKEKNNLTNQNLNDMINLLHSLSLNDRRAYAALLYNIPSNKTLSVPNTSNTTTSNQPVNIPSTDPNMSNVVEQKNTQSKPALNNHIPYSSNNTSYVEQPNNLTEQYLNNEEKSNQNSNHSNLQKENDQQ